MTSSEPPITLIPDWIDLKDMYNVEWFWDYLGLEYIDPGVGNVPRAEAWFNNMNMPYTYGRGKFARTYPARPMPEFVQYYLDGLNDIIVRRGWRYHEGNDSMSYPDMNCCFVNGYKDQRDHLGWHADDSPEMDDNAFIAILSIGAEREIWFKPKDADKTYEPQRVLLTNQSVLLMHPGMQKNWLHRIPKASRECGPRISMTFRGLDVDVIPEMGDPSL